VYRSAASRWLAGQPCYDGTGGGSSTCRNRRALHAFTCCPTPGAARCGTLNTALLPWGSGGFARLAAGEASGESCFAGELVVIRLIGPALGTGK